MLDLIGRRPARVHEARIDLKKARAALKLLDGAKPRKLVREELELCRGAARVLGPVRDAQALRRTWNGLGLRFAPSLDFTGDEKPLRESARLLRRARRLARKLRPRRRGWRALALARKAYVRSPKAYARLVELYWRAGTIAQR